MIFLLTRALPFFTALSVAVLTWGQFRWWRYFPWMFVGCVVVFLFSAFIIGRNRLAFREWIKLLPAVVVLVSVQGAGLFIDSGSQQGWIIGCSTGIVYLALELMYLLGHAPSKYPVHGLSRLNIALLPLGAMGLAMTLSGLQTFLMWSPWITILAFLGFGTLAFASTSHHASESYSDRLWVGLGALVGVHVGIITTFLPVEILSAGVIVAWLFALPLRIRRYSYEPRPRSQQAKLECILFAIGLGVIVLFSAWA